VNNLQADLIFEWVDLCFLAFYSLELSLNFYAHFFWEFWIKSVWNWFDFVVILVSWIPNKNLAAVRLLRILRLVRISGRVKSFGFVLETMQKSISNIFSLIAMLVGFVMIFAVLGVWLFRGSSEFRDFFSAL